MLNEPARLAQSQPSISLQASAWLTVERAGYGLAVLLAVALRLIGLGQQPFAPIEAEQAWSALALLRGESLLPASGASPLLLSLHWLTFGGTEASAGLARLWPALAGVAMVLLPFALRRELGRSGALASSFLLALSASLTFWSRAASGESFAYLGALCLLCALAGQRREGAGRWAVPAAASLALLLLAAPVSYSVLLALAPLASMVASGVRSQDDDSLAPADGPGVWARALPAFAGVVVLGATALFFNPGGLAAVADMPATWLRQLGAGSGYPWPWLMRQLAGEPLTVIGGVTGLWFSLRQGRDARPKRGVAPWLARGLAFWLVIAGVLTLRPGRGPADTGLVILPLTLLAGPVVADFLARLDLRGMILEAVVLLLAAVAVVGAGAVWLATYLGQSTAVAAFLIYAGAAAVILVVLVASYGLMFGRRVTAQVGLGALALVLLLAGLRSTMTTSHNSDGLRWGSLWSTTGATDGNNLPAYLAQWAEQHGGDRFSLDVALLQVPDAEPSPLLRWHLRQFQVQAVAGPAGLSDDAVLVSEADPLPSLDESYSGRSFRLAQTWSPQGLRGRTLLRWLVYNRFETLHGETRAVVWVKGLP